MTCVTAPLLRSITKWAPVGGHAGEPLGDVCTPELSNYLPVCVKLNSVKFMKVFYYFPRSFVCTKKNHAQWSIEEIKLYRVNEHHLHFGQYECLIYLLIVFSIHWNHNHNQIIYTFIANVYRTIVNFLSYVF